MLNEKLSNRIKVQLNYLQHVEDTIGPLTTIAVRASPIGPVILESRGEP